MRMNAAGLKGGCWWQVNRQREQDISVLNGEVDDLRSDLMHTCDSLSISNATLKAGPLSATYRFRFAPLSPTDPPLRTSKISAAIQSLCHYCCICATPCSAVVQNTLLQSCHYWYPGLAALITVTQHYCSHSVLGGGDIPHQRARLRGQGLLPGFCIWTACSG